MPRIPYDEDSPAPRKAAKPAPRWRRWLLKWALIATAAGLAALTPYVLYLNHQLSERFGALRWQEPTRVYARPLLLAQGLAMDAQTLRMELDAAAYHEGGGTRPGTFTREGNTWTIASRGFADIDGVVAPSRVEVVLANGQVQSLRDLGSDRTLRSARLDAEGGTRGWKRGAIVARTLHDRANLAGRYS